MAESEFCFARAALDEVKQIASEKQALQAENASLKSKISEKVREHMCVTAFVRVLARHMTGGAAQAESRP